mmetsp:Transcript_343/g.318  ORF Transcript_343/g.318 Transcript_343/m.318 type:complete len:98 (+) Transcript_343:55-348(+)
MIPSFNQVDQISKSSCSSNSTSKAVVSSQYQQFNVIKVIAQSKYKVFLIETKHDQTKLAMKIFPYENKKINLCYINEKKAQVLNHPSIVNIVYSQDK